MGWSGRLFLALFIGFWTALVGLFDVVIGTSLFQQLRASGYETTMGVISSAVVTRETGSKGRAVHSPDIRYSYVVDGRTYQGVRFRYNQGPSTDSAWAEKAVRDFPAGARVAVRYDRRRPGDAVLDAGVNGSDLMLPLFMTPFNAVLIGMWWAVGGWAVSKLRASPRTQTGGLHWSDDGRATRLRLDPLSPLAYAGVTVGLAAFVATFVALIGGRGFHPDIGLVGALWVLVLGAGVAVGVRQHLRQSAGAADLVIDRLARQVELPADSNRKTRIALPAADIASVFVAAEERRGRRGRVDIVHVVQLRRRAGRPERLIEFADKERADTLATWLRTRIGVA